MSLENKETNLESPAFPTFEDQKVFEEWLKINDSITPKFVSIEEFNNLKGDFIKENGKGGDGINMPKGYDFYIPRDLKIGELPAIIKRIN